MREGFFQRWKWVVVGLVAAAIVVVALAPVASGDPDGLDRVSGDKEFAESAEDPKYEWLPDYTVPGVDNEWASVVLAGLIGVGIVFVLPLGIGYVLRQTREEWRLNLDRYIDRDSPVHRADPRVKFLLVIGFILSLSLLPFGAFAAIAAAWVALLLTGMLARINPVRLARSGFVALPFLLAAVPLVFTRDGNILGHVDLGLFTLKISGEGLRDLGTIAFKSWVSVQAASLLIFTTRFHDLVHGLEQLRVPALFVAVMSLMYRYLAVLTAESSRMLRAREARSVRLPGRRQPSLFWRAKQVGNMVGALFLRSLERSERVYMAMQARGYHGRMVRLGTRRLTGGETAVLSAGLMTLAAFAVAGRFWIPVV